MFDTHRPPAPRAGCYLHHACTGLVPVTPAWHARTIFKPLGLHVPGLDPDDNDNWYRVLPDAVRYAGTSRHVHFLNRPVDYDEYGYEPTPFDLLRQRVWDLSHADHPDWIGLFRRDAAHHLALPNPRPLVLMQGWLYTRAGRDLRTAPMIHALLLLSPGAAWSMSRLLRDDAAVEQLLDPGDLHALELYRAVNDFEPPEGWRVVRECERPGDADRERGGTRHMVCRMLHAEPGSYQPTPTPQDHHYFRGWDTVVRRLTGKEQVSLLATAYPPQVLAAAFAGTRYAVHLPRRMARLCAGAFAGDAGLDERSGGGGGHHAA